MPVGNGIPLKQNSGMWTLRGSMVFVEMIAQLCHNCYLR